MVIFIVGFVFSVEEDYFAAAWGWSGIDYMVEDCKVGIVGEIDLVLCPCHDHDACRGSSGMGSPDRDPFLDSATCYFGVDCAICVCVVVSPFWILCGHVPPEPDH